MLRFRSLQPALRAAASARATLRLHAAAPLFAPAAPLFAPAVCVRRFGWFSAAPAAASTTASAAATSAAVGVSSAGAAAAAAPVVAAAPANNVVGIAAELASQSAAASTATSTVVTASSSASAASAASGIGWPTDWLEALLNSLHSSAGLPWWATIACATVIFRSAMIPLVVKQMKNIGQVRVMLLRCPAV